MADRGEQDSPYHHAKQTGNEFGQAKSPARAAVRIGAPLA
jgi:hypothetical protein